MHVFFSGICNQQKCKLYIHITATHRPPHFPSHPLNDAGMILTHLDIEHITCIFSHYTQHISFQVKSSLAAYGIIMKS